MYYFIHLFVCFVAVFGWNNSIVTDQHTLVGGSWWTHGRWCGDHGTHLGPRLAASEWGQTSWQSFHFDAKVVGMGATGDWNIDPKNHQLLDRLNWSSSNWPLALDVTGWYLLFLHVKAHSSQPCNDFGETPVQNTPWSEVYVEEMAFQVGSHYSAEIVWSRLVVRKKNMFVLWFVFK